MRRGWIYAAVLVSAATVSSVTSQSCPSSASDVATLNPLTGCVVTPLLTKTQTEIDTYISTGKDQQCVDKNNACNSALKFNKCSTTTADVMQFIIDGLLSFDPSQCASFLKGYPEYCSRPFGELVSKFCPDPPLIPVPAIIGIVVGGFFLVGLSIFVCFRTRRSLMLDKEIEDAVAFLGPLPEKGLQSNNPALVIPPQKSNYQGVEWNNAAAGWDAIYKTPNVREWLGTFKTQEQAARKYDQRVIELEKSGVKGLRFNFPDENLHHISSASKQAPLPVPAAKAQVATTSPPPGLGYSVDMSGMYDNDPDRERHIQELIHFYQVYDPERPDIEAHVLTLFNKYRFRGIARAILRKYGILPAGWSSEYDATRSLAMSMAARFFSPAQSPSNSAQVGLGQTESAAFHRDPAPNF